MRHPKALSNDKVIATRIANIGEKRQSGCEFGRRWPKAMRLARAWSKTMRLQLSRYFRVDLSPNSSRIDTEGRTGMLPLSEQPVTRLCHNNGVANPANHMDHHYPIPDGCDPMAPRLSDASPRKSSVVSSMVSRYACGKSRSVCTITVSEAGSVVVHLGKFLGTHRPRAKEHRRLIHKLLLSPIRCANS